MADQFDYSKSKQGMVQDTQNLKIEDLHNSHQQEQQYSREERRESPYPPSQKESQLNVAKNLVQQQHQMSVPYDEQVIPTLTKGPGKKGQTDEGGNDNGNGGGYANEMEENKVEEISPENMKYAEILIPVFGDEIVKKLFQRAWVIREEGLKECEELIKKNGNDQTVFQASLNAAGFSMGDKIANIIQRGMQLLQTTLKAATS